MLEQLPREGGFADGHIVCHKGPGTVRLLTRACAAVAQLAAEKLPSVQDKAGHVISATRRDLSGASHSLKPAYSSVF